MYYFTADTHLGHGNIIHHCQRPFASLEQMDETLIGNINEMVGPDDTLWILGDFAWKEPKKYLTYIYCKHIHILQGNHDHPNQLSKAVFGLMGKGVDIILEPSIVDMKIDLQRITLCHYPMLSWRASHYGTWHLFGHVHGNLKHPSPHAIDVGVDVNEFTPVSWDTVQEKIEENLCLPRS